MAPMSQQANAIMIGLSMLENLANKSSISNDGFVVCSIKKTRCLVLSVLVLAGALFSSNPVL